MKAHFMMSIARHQRDKSNKIVSVKRHKTWDVKEEDNHSLNHCINTDNYFSWWLSYFGKYGFLIQTSVKDNRVNLLQVLKMYAKIMWSTPLSQSPLLELEKKQWKFRTLTISIIGNSVMPTN